MSDDTELLPCPFCGGAAAKDDIGYRRRVYSVGCNNNACLIENVNTYSSEGYENPIAAWNRRAPVAREVEAKDAEIARLRGAARNIMPYLTFTIGPESPGHHPTMPSAVDAFCAALGDPA